MINAYDEADLAKKSAYINFAPISDSRVQVIKPSAMLDKKIVLGEVDILTDTTAIARYVDIITCEDKLQYSALANMLSNILNAAAKYNLGIVFSLYQSNIEDILSLEVYCENTNHYTRVIPLEGCKKYKAISVSVMPEPKLTLGNRK